ncbi:MAG: hypothetical protein GTN90_11455, partial [Xanthomonadales bacterium]|nr:hypothetical protein [Xanthomonadales bacterium]
MIDRLQDLVNGNPALVRRGRWTNADMLLEVGDQGHVVAIRQGRIEAVEPVEMNVSKWDFAIRANSKAWAEFWKPMP